MRVARPFSTIALGDRVTVKDFVYLQVARGARITIGDDVLINTSCHIVASEQIVIGDGASIAEFVSIRDQEHRFDVAHGVNGTGFHVAPVSIGANVWICRGAYIGPVTRIGAGSIVGANTVVKGDFPAGVLLAGAPAQIKREL